MNLRADVDARRREISSDNLSMSIGEMLNLYKDRELDIHPEFQRVFRWDIEQKSRLIESLLLGIPLPSIYVATDKDGVWEVIDGVQRLSTIFEFMGELEGPANADTTALTPKPPLVLTATKHLPALKDVSFETMESALRLEFKRTRLDIKVLAREQAGVATGKFDLFERLNTYGEPLSPQELRNCVLVSINPELFRWLKDLAATPSFRSSTLLSESQLLEQYDMDLALRFLLLRSVDSSAVGDLHDFLRDNMERIALDSNYDKDGEADLFREVFKFVDERLEGNAFRPWSEKNGSFRGGFSLGSFEGLAFSLGEHWPEIKKHRTKFDLLAVIKLMWSSKAYKGGFSGLKARDRMAKVRPAAAEAVTQELERLRSSSRNVIRRRVK